MLTVKAKMTLDLQRTSFRYQGSQDVEIRQLFDEHSASYYKRLNALLDDPEALEYAPDVVPRLRRLRAARAEQRSSRRADLVRT